MNSASEKRGRSCSGQSPELGAGCTFGNSLEQLENPSAVTLCSSGFDGLCLSCSFLTSFREGGEGERRKKRKENNSNYFPSVCGQRNERSAASVLDVSLHFGRETSPPLLIFGISGDPIAPPWQAGAHGAGPGLGIQGRRPRSHELKHQCLWSEIWLSCSFIHRNTSRDNCYVE